ncbi:retrovirus-related pol polyprotein from transposon TNT 1-94 [Tanacetum coccineum]
MYPQLVDKKGGSYSAVAPRLEPRKFNKWKKRMMCYLMGMEPYYIQCIKDGTFKPKIAKCDDKLESQWTLEERRMVNQDQHLKSVIISCLSNDIIESVISCETAKSTWTDLVHNFEGPSDTKEYMIMDLKLEYQTFRAKPSESLSQTYSRYKTLPNELANDDTKKALITTLLKSAFFSNNIVKDFQEFFYDEADKRSCEEYHRDLELEFCERALLENSKRFIKRKNNLSVQKVNEDTECYKCGIKCHFARDCFSKTSEPSYKSPMSNLSSVSKGFQPKFTLKFIQSSQHSQSSQGEPKVQKDYKAEYKKIKANLALLEASPFTSQSLKPFQSKNSGLVAKMFDWEEEEVSDDEEETQVKVLMALADDDLSVGKNHTRNIEWIDITMKKVNILLSMEEDSDWQTYLKYINIDIKIRTSNPSTSTKNLQGSSLSFEVMTLTHQDHSPKGRSGLDTMKHTKPETQESSNKSVLGPVTISDIKPVTSLVPSKVKTNYQESKIDREKSVSPFGTIFNANKEIVLIALRRNDVYVLDMSSLTPDGACFFAKASKSVNWLWHKRLSHLNFKNIDKLAKQNKVLGLPSLVYSKDKPCSACEKGKHKRDSFKTKQNFSIRKCLHLLHMDLFRPVSPMSINHEKYTLVIVDEYSRYIWVHFLKKKSHATKMIMSFIGMVENQNDVKVKQIRTDNAERKNRTLIEAARTMLNGLVFSKHFWIEAVTTAYYTQNRLIIVKRHDKTPYEIFKERIPDNSYFHVLGCLVFIHNHKDHLGKFDAKANDEYFVGYSFNSKAFRVFNTRRQQIEETYHINVMRVWKPLVIALNEQDTPHIEDVKGPHDLINTEGTQEQNVQNEQINHQFTEETSRNNTKISVLITESLVPKVPQSQDTNHASTSSYIVAQNRWSRDQHIELVNIIGDPGEGMLTRSMVAKLTYALASECLFFDFLSEIEPKKVFVVLKHLGWVDAMQEELNQFYKNKVLTLVPLPYGKITICSKWVFRNKKDEHGIVTKNKARLVIQGYSQEKRIDYDETFALVARMEAIRVFLAFATYINFIVFQMDVKSVFLNGKLKEEVYVK